MKRIIIIFSLLLISCNFSKDKASNLNESKTVKINGVVENLRDSLSILIRKIDSRNFYAEIIDSTLALNGAFELEIENNEPSEYMLMLIDYKNKEAKRNIFWLDEGDISISGNYNDFENAKISGSKLTEINKEYISIGEKYANQMKAGEIDMSEFNKGMYKERVAFLFENPNNPVSINYFLGYKNVLSKDSIRLFYLKLDNTMQNSKNGISIKNSIEIEKVEIGDQFIDIKATDLAGNEVKLSDFKGKVIVLDFWAYWCQFCHYQNQDEFPKLKEKYKNEDFVIISYSVDIDKKDWVKSSEMDKVDWVNISNLKGKMDKYAMQYGVEVYPTSFIIDKDGKILKKMKGYENGVMETALDKIFEIE